MRTHAPVELNPLVSVVIPCLNEAENIEQCVSAAWEALEANNISGEVIVSDNGSTDGSAELARSAGARVVHAQEERRATREVAKISDLKKWLTA